MKAQEMDVKSAKQFIQNYWSKIYHYTFFGNFKYAYSNSVAEKTGKISLAKYAEKSRQNMKNSDNVDLSKVIPIGSP